MMSASHQSDHRETDPLRLLENWLHSSDGCFTPDTAAAATGLSVDEITTALLTLVERYECRLQLDEASGAVVVQFTVPLVRLRPHENSFAGMVKTLGKTALRLGRVLYKASLGLVLTAYSVVYAVMLMGDDSGGLFWFIGWSDDEKKKKRKQKKKLTQRKESLLLDSNQVSVSQNEKYETNDYSETEESFWRDVQYVFSSSMAELRGEPIPPRVVGKGKKPFVYAVNDFVLGPDRSIFDVQAEQRTIAAFLQANGGHLTAGHIVALTGAAYHEAEATFVQVLVRFGGDASVREDGLIVAEFPHFVPTQHSLSPATNFEFYSDRHEEPITLTGNTVERNSLIALLNGFNLVMSVFSYVYFLEASWILTSVLSLFPFAVSSLFFLIPIARVPFVEHAETERLRRLLRRTMMGTILWSGKTEFRRDDFITAVNSVDARREQEVILNKLLVELEGEVTLDEESGVPVYRFPRLIAETR